MAGADLTTALGRCVAQAEIPRALIGQLQQKVEQRRPLAGMPGSSGAQTEPVMSPMSRLNAVHPLRDGGITWVFYFRRSEVPRRELEIVTQAKRGRFLRLAVTFGFFASEFREYRSTTAVHLWQMDTLPTTVSWREVFVHVFTHEPLHHAIGRSLAEIGERGDQEWVISRLGDGRWW